ncbi:MAG: Alpha-mannosidase, partial [Chthonomonadaceae bacterium]|nr:Alpha-mannosidase [Chthonomonadaceae bacterium]
VTEVDWQETDTMLKVAFPVAINSTRATYEIQYGHVERPTHMNTSWDQARFEVCAQKWADLSEGNYGVALLNDCKYGHDIQGHTLRLTLLRSPQAPDPTADRGLHRFTYSLLPHNGDFREGEVVENAYALNSPPVASALPANRPGPLPLERSFFEVDNAAVFIEAIKRAEKENAIIVRLYEVHNTRGSVTLTTTLPVKSAWYCDLMEKSLAEIPVSGGEMLLPIQPFEIVTIKLLL